MMTLRTTSTPAETTKDLIPDHDLGAIATCRKTDGAALAPQPMNNDVAMCAPGHRRHVPNSDRRCECPAFEAGVVFRRMPIMRISRTGREHQHGAFGLTALRGANIGPNRFHQSRTASWQMSIPRSASMSSTFRRDSGNFTYIMTTVRIISGDDSNQRNGSWVFVGRAFLSA